MEEASVKSEREESDNENSNDLKESVSVPAPKYSLRSPVQNRLFKDDVLLDESGGDSEPDDICNQSALSECSTALKTYFYDRLLQVVLFLGGTVADTQGWRVQVTKKDGGLTMGLLEVEYINSYNRKFKNRVEVASFLGLMATVRNIRSMTRDQHFINAIEVREIHLISQLLATVGFRCSEFQYSSDVISIKYLNDQNELASAPSTDGVSGERLHFSFGNCTILNWGKITQDVNFHSATQIYPVGFKCLRQEHDVKLDRIVDCLCEVDSVPVEPSEGNSGNSSSKKPSLLPVFRITVSWELLNGSQAVRVYEARTPQQAWQAVLLERVGTKEEQRAQGDAATAAAASAESGGAVDDFEPADEEELQLRNEIREQRRLYFRALRAEQTVGHQAAAKPRLALDTVDSFGEDLILRMIEGMEGSFKCSQYQFLDSREKEAGKKNMLRAYSKIFVKAKNLDKVIGRSSSHGGGGRKRVRVEEGGSGGVTSASAGGNGVGKKMKGDYSSSSSGNNSNKQLRTLSQAFMRNRTAKIRELEKGVTILKAAMIRNIKRRRDDAKLFVEAECEREELSKVAAAAAVSEPALNGTATALSEEALGALKQIRRPDATANGGSSLLMDGEVFGQVLEIWEYLNTFAKPLKLVSPFEQQTVSGDSAERGGGGGVGVPPVTVLLQTMKSLDPAYRILSQYVKGLEHTYDFIASSSNTKAAEAGASSDGTLLNDLGMALTSPLLKEFERLLGVDQVEAQVGDVRIPINTLTWREVARVVLMQSACRDLGMADADIATMIKGRGFFTTPESADRKTLKLARRRIVCNYSIRDEFQESLFGFQCGQVVRIPAPGVPLHPTDIVWSDLIHSLRQVPDSSSWLIEMIVRNAAWAACAVDRSPSAKKLRKALLDCLSSELLRSTGASKQAALSLLQSTFYLGFSGSDPPLVSPHSTAAGGSDRLKLLYDFTPYSLPSSTCDLWAKQVKEGVRCAVSEYADNLGDTAEGEIDFEEAMLLAGEVKEEEEEESDDDEGKVESKEEAATAAVAAPTASDAAMNLSQKSTGSDETAAVAEEAKAGSADAAARDTSTAGAADDAAGDSPSKADNQLNEAEWREPDSIDAEKLSIAMQRCYLVMRDLMSYSHAKHFLLPVDVRDVPLYYKYTAQPLSLSEIRSHLVSGGYNDSLFSFYSDVNLVIENALSFNLEGSPAKAAALKLQIIFERLFFETVLFWEHPLPFHDSCHFCRSGYPVPNNKGAVCDRCEASYHLHCLDLTCPPRSEWFCFPCVEQRSIANAHPYKTADVRHPFDPEAVGEVVGIEQIKQTLMFVVAFGSVREMWTPKKVREFAVDRTLFDQHLTGVTLEVGSIDGTGVVVKRSSKTAISVPPPLVISLPTGYSIEDYDHVCGLARGYSGWGGSHCLVPSVLLDSFSAIARQGAKLDVLLDKTRRAVAALGAAGQSPDETCANEWTVILRSLLQKALASPALTATMAQFEDVVDDHLVHRMLECVQNNDLSLAKLSQFRRDEKRKAAKPPGTPTAAGKKRGPKAVAASLSDEDASGSEESASDDEDDSSSDDSSLFSEEAEFDEPLPGRKILPSTISNDALAAVESTSDEADSEDDLDFFDENGECLTSGARPPKVDPRVVEEQWEVRQLSRQKGREDALLTEVLVWDILNELDVDGTAEAAEEGFSVVQQDLGPFYKAATNAIVKSCVGKPSESLLIEDWCTGWDMKMISLHKKQHQHPDQIKSELVCPFCGGEEGYLGSPFVRGLSRSEYESFMQSSSTENNLIDNCEVSETKDPASMALQRARQPASRASIQALLTPGSISANTGIKGFRARNRALNGLVWMPYDEADAAVERAECALINRPMVAGSLVVHECCADFMHFNRQLSEGRYQSSEDKRVVEILLGVGRGKSTPLGCDREGCLYWVFLGSTTLYVSNTSRNNSSGEGGETEDDAMEVEDSPPGTKYSASINDSACTWYCYDSVADIASLIHWLDERISSEKLLKRIVSLLFPQSLSYLAPAEPTSANISRGISVCASIADESESENEAAADSSDAAAMQVVREELTSTAPTEVTHTPVAAGPGNDDDGSSSSSDSESESDSNGNDGVDEEAEFDESIPESKLAKREVRSVMSESIQQSVTATVRSGNINAANEAAAYRRGDQVLVESSEANHILWEAKVIDVKRDEDTNYYKVHFHQWSAAYDGWYTGDCIMPLHKSREGAKQQVQRSRNQYLKRQVYEAPAVLQTLSAYRYMSESKRASGPYRPPLSFSDAHSTLGALRTALLMIEAALPLGAVDEGEDRWGEQFVVSWRHAVCASGDATSLMQCQIMLEYGVKTAWLKPTGLKMFSCLPSRTLSMRNATCGMVAIRLWLLDQTIKYDKVFEEEKTTNRGRPPKKESTAAVTSSSSSSGGAGTAGGGGGVSKAGRPKTKKVIRDE